jgi:hypothetical protein
VKLFCYLPRLLSVLFLVVLCATMSVRAATPAHVQGTTPIIGTLYGGVSVPSDAQSRCSLSSSTFASWFQSGHVGLDGVVNPPNALAFPTTGVSDCDFFLHFHHIFLWATSPELLLYGPGMRIYDTPTFFDVSAPDAHGSQTLIPHVQGQMHFFAVRAAKVGANGLPILFSASGRVLEVVPTRRGPHKLPIILDRSGTPTEIQRITLDANGKPTFYDQAGKVISAPHPSLSAEVNNTPSVPRVARPQVVNPLLVQKFLVHGVPVYIDQSGNPVPIETGQANGGVLESRTGSLVYYSIMVNDVYAYFLTGQKTLEFLATQFPTTQRELNEVVSLAAKHHVRFYDANALAVELKMSWVDASKLPDPGNYITTSASVPSYDESNPNKWVPIGTQTLKLALVGMHIVASLPGHPDLVWSTFEHLDNAPNASYAYASKSGLKTVGINTRGFWVFCCKNPDGPFNQAHMLQSGSDIVSSHPFTISPSDTIRWKPWGTASNVPAGLISTTQSNADVIALNADIIEKLPSGDPRSKYILIGATWTEDGNGPTGDYPKGNAVGTDDLMNTTLETYTQGSSTRQGTSFSCFACHSASSSGSLLVMSHIYPNLQPLWGKNLHPTVHTLTFKPSHKMTQVSWATPQSTPVYLSQVQDPTNLCAGGSVQLSYPPSAWFQAANNWYGPAFTGFFPFLTSVQNNAGWVGIPGVFAGVEQAVLAGTYSGDGVVGDCYIFPASTVTAQSGVVFDLRKLGAHPVYSASLILNPLNVLKCCNGSYYQVPNGGNTTSGPSGGSGGQGYYKKTPHRPLPVVTDKKGRRVQITTFPPPGPAAIGDARAGWCPTSVFLSRTKWWSINPLNLTYYIRDQVATIDPVVDGPASIDVTSLVSRWASTAHNDNDGFIVSIPLSLFEANGYGSNACVMNFDVSLQVVYFD